MRRLPVVLLALCLGLAGCSSGPAAERDGAGAIATEGAVDAFGVKKGDCLDEPEGVGEEGEEVDSVDAVPCDRPHDVEAYEVFDLADGDYPGDDAVTDAADEGCVEAWEPFVGVGYEESELDFYTFQPTEGSWSDGDREVVCLIGDPEGGPVTGTLQGAAR